MTLRTVNISIKLGQPIPKLQGTQSPRYKHEREALTVQTATNRGVNVNPDRFNGHVMCYLIDGFISLIS